MIEDPKNYRELQVRRGEAMPIVLMDDYGFYHNPIPGKRQRSVRDEMMASVVDTDAGDTAPVPSIDQQMQAVNERLWSFHDYRDPISEALDHRENGIWFVGLMGACNIVTMRDGVMQGVGYTPDAGAANQIVKAHNDVVTRFHRALIKERYEGAFESTT